jgi:hypothetical protein
MKEDASWSFLRWSLCFRAAKSIARKISRSFDSMFTTLLQGTQPYNSGHAWTLADSVLTR